MLEGEYLRQFDEILATARSVRRRINFDLPLDASKILECIEIAIQAPTGAGGENWRFLVVQDLQKKTRIASVYSGVMEEFATQRNVELKPTHRAMIQNLHRFPAMVFACMDQEPPRDSDAARAAYYGSILPAAWSLMLAFRARGIGATWTTLLSARHDEVRQILKMPQSANQIVMLPIGYTKNAVFRKADRTPADRVTFWNEWGSRR